MISKKISVAIIGGIVLSMSPVKTFAEEDIWEIDDDIDDDVFDDDGLQSNPTGNNQVTNNQTENTQIGNAQTENAQTEEIWTSDDDDDDDDDFDDDDDEFEDDSEDDEVVQQLAKISIAKKNYIIKKKQKVQIKIKTNRYAGGIKSIRSSNPKVASVNAKGVVVGKSDGVAVITVISKKGKVKAQTDVVVGKAVKFTDDKVDITTKKKTKLKLIGNGKKKVKSWKSSNKKVVQVNKKGQIKAVKSGSATITATLNNGKKTKSKIKVLDKTKHLILEDNYVEMSDRDDDVKINVRRYPAVSVGKITYRSSNPNVAMVDADGMITSVDAGSCTISVKCNGKVKKVKVTVYPGDEPDDDDDDEE